MKSTLVFLQNPKNIMKCPFTVFTVDQVSIMQKIENQRLRVF